METAVGVAAAGRAASVVALGVKRLLISTASLGKTKGATTLRKG
jgi:hypothetical protein